MTQARITVTRDTIDIDELRLTDAALAAFVSETPEADRPALAERAIRIGLLTLANAGVSLSADVVKAEFERLTDRMEATQKRAAEALATTLRENFADGDGRLPRTLERFLGDDGQLRRITRDLFDENQRESALGKLNEILGKYFDGDGSRLAHLLDPTRRRSKYLPRISFGLPSALSRWFSSNRSRVMRRSCPSSPRKRSRVRGRRPSPSAKFSRRVVACPGPRALPGRRLDSCSGLTDARRNEVLRIRGCIRCPPSKCPRRRRPARRSRPR